MTRGDFSDDFVDVRRGDLIAVGRYALEPVARFCGRQLALGARAVRRYAVSRDDVDAAASRWERAWRCRSRSSAGRRR